MGGHTASCVLWLGFLAGWSEGCVSSKWGYEFIFPAQIQQDKQLKPIRLFVCGLNSSQPRLYAPWLYRATGFALQNTALPVHLWARRIAAGLHSFWVFMLAPLLRWGFEPGF